MEWNTDSTANRFIKSYVQDFIDISGSLTLREKSNLNVNGSTTINGNLFLNNVSLLTDLSFNKRIFVGGDCSINGNLTSLGDISINGAVTSCLFKNSSIPQTAFAGLISAPGPDYTKPSVFYEQKFKADADISLNGNVVKVDRININGNVKLSDATLMNKYDNNMAHELLDTYSSSVKFTKPSLFGATHNDPSWMKMVSSNFGKIVLMTAGDNGYKVAGGDQNTVDPVGTLVSGVDASWNDYTRFGAYISRDFGNTWTKYLMPYENEIKLGFCYYHSAMTRDGKHMAITVVANGNNPNGLPCAIAFSHDYGYTWSSIRVPFYVANGPGTAVRPGGVCLSEDGRKMLVTNGGQGESLGAILFWYFSIDYGLSWSKTPNWGPAIGVAGLLGNNSNRLFCNPDLSIIITQSNINQIDVVRITLNNDMTYASSKVISSGTSSRLAVDGTAFPTMTTAIGSTTIMGIHCSSDFKTVLFVHSSYKINTSSIIKIEMYDAVTDRWRYGTMTVQQPGWSDGTKSIGFGIAFMSRSGKFIYMPGGGPGYITAHFISSDYGATFTQIYSTNLAQMPTLVDFAYVPPYAIMDDGSFLHWRGNDIAIFKPNVYKASIFTSLNINGNLVAGSFPTSSDYRIKTDIAALDPTFTVDNLRPVKYLQTLINKTRYGVIAHELQLYYPDLVVGEKDGEELQNVNYTGLIAILINEIKRLKQEVLELENEV